MLELGVLGEREHDFELRRRPVSGGDQIATGQQRRRAKLLGWIISVMLAGEVVKGQVAVSRLDIEAMQFQMLVEAWQTQEAFPRRLAHLQQVAEAHEIGRASCRERV